MIPPNHDEEKIPPDYDEEKYQNQLRTTSAPAALWAQLQAIERQRAELRGAFLDLVGDDEGRRAEMRQLLNALERLTVQWHRMYLDALAGVEALSSASIAEVLRKGG